MKKLLSILTISTLTASIPTPLLANAPLTRVKRDVSALTSNANNNYLPIKKNNGISAWINGIIIDSSNSIYYATDTGAYKLSAGSDTPTKIDGISWPTYPSQYYYLSYKGNTFVGLEHKKAIKINCYELPIKICWSNDFVVKLILRTIKRSGS
ncbi:hypothetical protein [Spiroplasma poulsonii]|uniref:hypothetical protein n=1 Tax=Spiroplasma poulsonii TaxID=2138 RepID=UPI0013313CB0|nr:hypothetical protein [Spiroplasma poulsonii]KAF0849861.1 putative Adhesion Related Protein 1 [Spiroplasma poulsonii]